MKILIPFMISLFLLNCSQKENSLKPRQVQYYLNIIKNEIQTDLQNKNVLNDSLKLKDKFFTNKNNKKTLTNEGIKVRYEPMIKAMKKHFITWNYLNHIADDKYVYVLYFSMAGFNDMEWQAVRFKKSAWENQEKIDKKELENLKSQIKNGQIKIDKTKYFPLFFNYDEGDANHKNIKFFIKNRFLVLERNGLYHSLYDLDLQKTILNEESPWHSSGMKEKEEMNLWIKQNLHSKIDSIISQQQ